MRKLYTGEPDERCPLMGGKLCAKVCPSCKFQQSFTVTNNVTGEVSTHWDCAFTMQTQLQMEGNLFTQGIGRAVESFRNETVERSDALLSGSVKIASHMINGYNDGQRLSLPRYESDGAGNTDAGS